MLYILSRAHRAVRRERGLGGSEEPGRIVFFWSFFSFFGGWEVHLPQALSQVVTALAIRARVVILKKITIFYIVDELYTLRDVEPKRFSMYGPSMLENKNYTNFARKCNT